MSVEGAAILANPEAFLLIAALARGGGKCACRLAGGAIFFDIEAREMLPDDLLRRIAFDALCALIPACDRAVRIQHINRIIGHALDQQAELFLMLLDRRFRLPPFGQIARDLGETEKLAGRRTDGIDHHICPEAAAILADAPAFVFEFPFPRGSVEGALRQSVQTVFRRVEAGEMLADDFFAVISLEAARPGIPAGHRAGGIEHINGIIGDGFDQQPISALVDLGREKRVGLQ